jgi:hypothetical protein
VGLTTPHRKNKQVKKTRAWTDSLDKRPKRWTMDMRFGTMNVRSLYRAGSVVSVKRNYQNKSRNEGGPMEGPWHQTSRRIYIFLWKRE